MFDVVFITPNMGGNMSEESIGTLQLATILKQHGITCDILPFFKIGDLSNFNKFLNNAIKLIKKANPKIVSFYTRCDTYHIMLKLAEVIKESFKNIYVVCGGPQSDITAVETIKQIPYVDYVCCGEGENTVYPFFSSLINGTPDYSVDGLVYRKDKEVITNTRPAFIEDLDVLPFLDYSLLKFKDESLNKKRIFSIDVGRGCPFGCAFCSTNSFWGRKFRLKSPERICEEIKIAHDKFGRTRFNFSHDMFTVNRNKVIETCSLLKTLDLPIQWGCSARLDCIDNELIDIMADSGMIGIYLGIETGSPRMQKLINKKLDLENATQKIAYLKSKGIKTTASFIYGFPEETEHDISLTISLIGELLNLKTVNVQTHLCAFMVGTELSEKYKSEMTPVEQYSDETGEYAIEECQDIIKKHPNLFQHMYEYKTELRSKLKYFPLFFNIWQYVQPVYQYISQKYSKDNMINMYYDFVNANKKVLEENSDATNNELLQKIINDDGFAKQLSDDVNYDLVKDIYRFINMQFSDKVQCGETVTDTFCFAPEWMKHFDSLEEYPRCVAQVTCSNKKTNTIILDF